MLIKQRQRGIVLLMVLGILALMSVLAVSFVQLTSLEKAISRNYVDRTRAIMAAESGVEYAISRLVNMGNSPNKENLEAMLFNDGDYLVSIEEMTAKPSFQSAQLGFEQYSAIVGSSVKPDSDRVRLKIWDESGKLNLNDTNGNWNIDTDAELDKGTPVYDYFDDADGNGMPAYPNLPLPADAIDESEQVGRLGMIVEELGNILFGPSAGALISLQLFSPTVSGSRPNLPGNRFSTFAEVEFLLVDSLVLTSDEFAEFRQNVTLWSWQDKDTIRPTFQLYLQTNNFRSFAGGLPDPSQNPDPSHNLFPDVAWSGFDVYQWRDMQSRHFELEARSPININVASENLLQALMGSQDSNVATNPNAWGLQGWYLREGPGERMSSGRYGNYAGATLTFTDSDEKLEGGGGGVMLGYRWEMGKNNSLGMARVSPLVGDPHGLASAIFDRIHDPSLGKPFATWEEFEHFLRFEVDPTLIYPIPQSGFAIYEELFSNFLEGRRSRIDPVGGLVNINASAAAKLTLTDGTLSGSDDFRVNWGSGDSSDLWWIDYMYNLQVDALLANFNPNTQSNEYTPNRTIHRIVDKNHLVSYTTEFTFDAGSTYAIESLGVIMQDDGAGGEEIAARSGIETVVQIFETYRHTTQQQFMGRTAITPSEIVELDLGEWDSGEPVTGAFVESPSNILSAAEGFYKTRDGDSNRGFTTQVYPEPMLKPDSVSDLGPWNDNNIDISGNIPVPVIDPIAVDDTSYFSPYDGYIMLATLQNDFGGSASLYHHFNGSLISDSAKKGVSDYYYQFGSQEWLPTYRNRVTATRLMNPKVSAGALPSYPGNLYPDGAYSEVGRVLSVPMGIFAGSSKGDQGSISFWVKPQYDPAITGRVHNVVRMWGSTGALDIKKPLSLGVNGGMFQEQVITPPGSGGVSVGPSAQMGMYYFCHDYDAGWYKTFDGLNAIPDPDPMYVANVLNYVVPHPLEPGGVGGLWSYTLGEMMSADIPKWGWEDETLRGGPFATPPDMIEVFHLNQPGWIPQRSFGVGWGGMRDGIVGDEGLVKSVFGRWTNTVNHNFPGHSTHSTTFGYHFEGHAWNHIAFSWDASRYNTYASAIVTDATNAIFPFDPQGAGAPSYDWFAQGNILDHPDPDALPMMGEDEFGPPHPTDKMIVTINGFWINNVDMDLLPPPDPNNPPPEYVNNPPEYFEGNYGIHAGSATTDLMFVGSIGDTTLNKMPNHYIRFGEFNWNRQANAPMMDAYSSDAVYDEIVMLPGFTSTPTAMTNAYLDGRYYADDPDLAYFQSLPVNLHRELNLSRLDGLKLVGVKWTCHMPRFNRTVNWFDANFPGIDVNPFFTPADNWPVDPMDGFWNNGNAAGQNWDPISVDISIEPDTVSTPYVSDFWWTDGTASLNTAKKGMPAYAGGSKLRDIAEACEDAAGFKVDYESKSIVTSEDKFQYRIYFNYKEGTGVRFYEVPVLDDITFTFALIKPRILSWRVVDRFQ